MSKTVINKREQLKWNNGFDPNGKSIPDITAEDEGKILKVEDGVLTFGEDAGTVLPSYSSSDEGKVLTVNSSGNLEWDTDDGTTYTAGDNIQISADNVISATDTTYTAGDNVAINADNEISSVNTIVFDAKYFRATDTFQYDADAIAPFLTEVFKNDKRAVVRVQDGNYNNYDIYTLTGYQSGNKTASFSKVNPSIVSANQREIVCSHIALYISNGVGTLRYTNEGVTDLPEGATQGQIAISDGHNGWVAGNIPTELPSVSSSDEGKILKVDSNGDWAVGTDDNTTYSAGTNITIDANNQISATDTTYSAGTGITINGTTISADSQLPTVSSSDEGKVLKVNGSGNWVAGTDNDTTYSAGTGISISANNEISADSQLPSVSSSDEGKVLKVDSNGDWAVGNTSPAYPSATGTLYTFTWDSSSADAQTYTATEDCIVEYFLYGVGGESGSISSLGMRYTIDINKSGGVSLLHRAGRFTTMDGTKPTVEDFIFLKKGYTITITHIIRHSTSASYFTARSLE